MSEGRFDWSLRGGAGDRALEHVEPAKPHRSAFAPEELLVDALLRLDALRAALGAGDIEILISVARRLKDRGVRHGAHELAALLAQTDRAASGGDLSSIGDLLDQADHEVARLDAETRASSALAC